MLKAIWSWLRKDQVSRDILKTSLALLYNAAYALFNLILAWNYQSEWYLMMAMFLFPLCIMRFLLLMEWKKHGENGCRPDILHVSGFIMLFLSFFIKKQSNPVPKRSTIKSTTSCKNPRAKNLCDFAPPKCVSAQPAHLSRSTFRSPRSGGFVTRRKQI